MMAIRWSWIFILYSLLVRLGSATLPDDDYTVDEIHGRAGAYQSRTRILDFLNFDSTTVPPKPPVGAIVGGSIGGLAVLCIPVFFFLKRRHRITDVEEGPRSPTTLKKERRDSWLSDPKSRFSPDGKNSRKISRLRDALSRRPGIGKKAPLDNILPTYNVALTPSSTESIDRPPPTVPTQVPHHPSILERGSKKKRPPPPLTGYPDFSRISTANSVESIDSNEGETTGRQKLRMPPTALVVPTPGRTLPNTVVASARSAGLHMRKSPSRRRSLFSKNSFKHPFIPVRGVDTALRFPPGSPLSAQYQPSRKHLEARMEARSPRIEGSPRSVRLGRDSGPVRRQSPPPDEPGSSKQVRLVEALQSAGIEISRTPRTPVPNGSLTALPPHSTKHPLRSVKFSAGPPTVSYI